MKYISTRAQAPQASFCRVLLSGLADDGGLYVPAEYPRVDADLLDRWRSLNYRELAFEIMSLFIDDIPSADLRELIDRTYTGEVFGSDDIISLRRLGDGIHILGLSNGPTLAFKDIAMQFLGRAFEYVLARRGKTLNILGATSGDTGSAAEYAMRGKRGITVFMLSPHGKMSAFQRAQMYTLHDDNIFNIAVKGMFDDCQDIVKTIQSDAAFKEKYRVGTINSINWARIAAQTVYYFKAYLDITSSSREKISFAVPSGNFGNICAGHIARMMGLPIARLIVATNENDVLDEFFRSGIYRPRAGNEVVTTSCPSMDIAKASNLERFVFDLMRRDGVEVAALWAKVGAGQGFDLHGKLRVMRERFGFESGKSTHRQRLDTIREVYEKDGEVIDPHTAAGVHVARRLRLEGETVVCLETALPVKFEDTVREALGADFRLPVPTRWQDIERAEQRVTVMPDNADAVKMFMRERLDERAGKAQ